MTRDFGQDPQEGKTQEKTQGDRRPTKREERCWSQWKSRRRNVVFGDDRMSTIVFLLLKFKMQCRDLRMKSPKTASHLKSWNFKTLHQQHNHVRVLHFALEFTKAISKTKRVSLINENGIISCCANNIKTTFVYFRDTWTFSLSFVFFIILLTSRSSLSMLTLTSDFKAALKLRLEMKFMTNRTLENDRKQKTKLSSLKTKNWQQNKCTNYYAKKSQFSSKFGLKFKIDFNAWYSCNAWSAPFILS